MRWLACDIDPTWAGWGVSHTLLGTCSRVVHAHLTAQPPNSGGSHREQVRDESHSGPSAPAAGEGSWCWRLLLVVTASCQLPAASSQQLHGGPYGQAEALGSY